jgi:hypothetical protein
MIISKYSKSYDTADGSEQQFRDPEPNGGHGPGRGAERGSAKAAGQRWEDDGGSLAPRPPLLPKEILAKPPWSVLPLSQLNETIRLEQWVDNPAHVQRRADEAERRRLRAIDVEEERVASLARTERDRHRNHWENT